VFLLTAMQLLITEYTLNHDKQFISCRSKKTTSVKISVVIQKKKKKKVQIQTYILGLKIASN
jgi:hypoxanthine-guanine phosphoribosyltransferase